MLFGNAGHRKMRPEFGAALFTLEGIIIDVFHLRIAAWEKIFDEAGVPFKDKWEEEVAEGDHERLLELISEPTGSTLSDTEKRQIVERFNQYYERLFSEVTPKNLQPGIGPLLKVLKKNGVRIALVSFRKDAVDIIERLDIGAFFDKILDGSDAESEKPALELFLSAADGLNVSYNRCVVIESIDAEAPLIGKTKMPVVVVGGKKVQGAARVVDTTSEITYEGLKELFHKKRS